MRMFELHRDQDETGMSGTGVVAQGVEFIDGTVAMQWFGTWPTSVVFHQNGMASVMHLHSHGGKTRVVYLDTMPINATRGRVQAPIDRDDPKG